jgi:hypothetical protein
MSLGRLAAARKTHGVKRESPACTPVVAYTEARCEEAWNGPAGTAPVKADRV